MTDTNRTKEQRGPYGDYRDDYEQYRPGRQEKANLSSKTVNTRAVLIERVKAARDRGAITSDFCADILQAIRSDETDGLPVTQEPKYTVRGGRLVNRASGKPIPDDEPIFVFRAKDRAAVYAIMHYRSECLRNPDHHQAVDARVGDFLRFAEQHPERMKWPDTSPEEPTPELYTQEALDTAHQRTRERLATLKVDAELPTPERPTAVSTWTCEHCGRVNDTATTFNRCPFCSEFRKGYAEKPGDKHD